MDIAPLLPNLPKRKNMSVDVEKTKARCLAAWKGMKNVQKNEVLSIADASPPTLHKTYKNGHISAGVAIALAQVAGIQPMYLTGDSDREGKFSAKSVDTFLRSRGIRSPFEQTAPKMPAAAPADDAVCDCECADIEMADEEMIILLEGLLVRSRFNAGDAARLEKVKRLLIG
ncbi:MAG: hypothetical protein LBR85_08000 [Oscillospiraceae bacterium]|jgi:hypothetical protein|nr:hypothetical protein [Oscillospiraceae bacterium]